MKGDVPRRPPLSGIRVVEFAGYGPTTLTGMMLADLGADVIRVERVESAADVKVDTMTRGRRSLALDLKTPDGKKIVQKLLSRSDVSVEGFRPGVLGRLGFSDEACLALNGRLVICHLTGWGQDGPLSRTAGHDLNYLAVTGALYPLGHADLPPPPPLNYVADMGGGAMFAVTGILAALLERGASGLGQVIDAAMVDGSTLIASAVFRGLADGSWSQARGTNILDGSAPFYATYRCGDGGFVAVGAVEEQFYRELVSGLGLRLKDIPDRGRRENWQDLKAIFSRKFETRTRDEWAALFADTDGCVAPVLAPHEAPDHPHNRFRERFMMRDGRVEPRPAPRFGRSATGELSAAPRKGGDTRSVLAEIGIGPAETMELIDRGIVAQPSRDKG